MWSYLNTPPIWHERLWWHDPIYLCQVRSGIVMNWTYQELKIRSFHDNTIWWLPFFKVYGAGNQYFLDQIPRPKACSQIKYLVPNAILLSDLRKVLRIFFFVFHPYDVAREDLTTQHASLKQGRWSHLGSPTNGCLSHEVGTHTINIYLYIFILCFRIVICTYLKYWIVNVQSFCRKQQIIVINIFPLTYIMYFKTSKNPFLCTHVI